MPYQDYALVEFYLHASHTKRSSWQLWAGIAFRLDEGTLLLGFGRSGEGRSVMFLSYVEIRR